MSWWKLPGPSNFIARNVEALRAGYNLVLPTPVRGVAELAETLRRNLLDEGWRVAGPFDDEDQNPIDQLYAWLDVGDNDVKRRSIGKLRDSLDPGQVVIVQGIDGDHWRSWEHFMTEYEAASRVVSKFDRPLVVAVVTGVPLSNFPERAPALLTTPWQDVVGELDVLLFVREAMRVKHLEGGKEKLLSRIVTKLALWDFELAEYLAGINERELFDPVAALRGAADALGRPDEFAATWEAGGKIKFDGMELEHSMLLLRHPVEHGKLVERLWQAQAGELLPLLELSRRYWVQRMRPVVRLPIRVNETKVNDLNELEIGQLAYVARSQTLNHAIQQATEKLRRYRNKLAHIEVLEYSEAFDPDLRGR
ncbi:MAG: hypothetical protein V5B60_00595 [Accumulibacter sp.]|jgi:hypothetical protein|uniref:hypothetical protein n=1 Tax=Accumulibacter sp. TaxID=2053492 RepID=UPI002FC3D999